MIYSSRTVHPHARGEHITQTWELVLDAGSSPRTWGTPIVQAGRRRRVRFIPTHVGNTHTHSPRAPSSTVHPHARGEHTGAVSTARSVVGSSPRTWGTRAACCAWWRLWRFIPTHVGNTACSARFQLSGSVHPHARGEHAFGFPACRASHGSSPRTWGTHQSYLVESTPLFGARQSHRREPSARV